MPICINCGQESESCLCYECKQTVDIETLCDRILAYKPGMDGNKLWDEIAASLCSSYNFKNIIFALTDELPSPRKEYRRILCMLNNACSVAKNSRAWLYEEYEICRNTEGLSVPEINRVKGLVIDALYKDYMFDEAEKLATEVMESDSLPKQVYVTLADFYIKTWRFDKADEILTKVVKLFSEDEYILSNVKNLASENAQRREKVDNGKPGYMPSSKENKYEVRHRFVDFLASIGIKAEMPSMGARAGKIQPIPRDEYPEPIETRDTDFDSFVAFDLETTGTNIKIDSIIEFGAIKIVNGQIVDSQEFTFQEFAKPYKRKMTEEVQKITGITPDDAKDAREMWEVTPDFMRFVGDSVLVGFNCMAFDSRFMARAGRYAHIIIENKYFDVKRYAAQFKEQLGIESDKCSLEEVSKKLGIENPRAHRALADAITTARVFLKLKSMDDDFGTASVDDMLSDIDNW